MTGPSRALTSIQLDRAAGVLVASAAGDALGAAYEFGPRCAAGDVEMGRGALTGRDAGSWTDDTDLSVCVAQAAAAGLPLDARAGLDAVAGDLLRWYGSGPPDIGNQTRGVLSAARAPADVPAAALDYQRAHPHAAGNGSLMRTGPVALAHLGDDEALATAARAVSSLTHPHPLAGDACVLWCAAIDRAVRSGTLEGPRAGVPLLPPERRAYWADVIDAAERVPVDELRDNGFVVTALQAAWRSIVATADGAGNGGAGNGPAHLESALRAAVAIGGDTDTVAAIAGALLGARYGASAVPFAWRYRLGGWPEGLGHGDLVRLGVLAASGGVPDGIGWPLAADLLPHYLDSWHPTGEIVELDGHPGVRWGDMAGLARVDAASFVSLCRIGRDQRRGPTHHEVWLMDGPDNADTAFSLADTADAVEALARRHGSVFVHCVRAESRTPSVAAAWLVRHRGMGPDQAWAAVRAAMPAARPHRALRAALEELARLPVGRGS